MSRRILMVALDALDIGLFRKALASGRIPNLAAFTASAIEAEIRSFGDEMEGAIWPSFASGTNPGTHGHYWYSQWFAEEGRFLPANDPRLSFQPYWNDALEVGKRVVVFDLPYTSVIGHPLERSYNGWGVQDEMSEEVSPPSFRKDILKRYGKSLTRKDTLLVRTAEDRLRLARRSKASARQRSQILVDLAARRDWDLLIFGYGEFHRAGHHLAAPEQLSSTVTTEQAMMALLRPIDEAWPRIVAAAGEDCDVIVFGLHGMRPLVADGSTTRQLLDHMAGKTSQPPGPPDLLRRLRNLVPQRVHERIWLSLPSDVRINRVANGWLQKLDLEHDPILMLEAISYRLNIAGREPRGIVQPSEAHAVAETFWRETQRYKTPDGRPAFGPLIWTEDRFPGPRSHRLPDFSIPYAQGVEVVHTLVRDDGLVIRSSNADMRNGFHTNTGFCFLRPAGTVALKQDAFEVPDFAPTILERLGVTPPGHLEGVSFLR